MISSPRFALRHLLAVFIIVAITLGLSFLLPLPHSEILPNEQPPTVLRYTPERGEEADSRAPIQVIFDQPMERASTEAAFEIRPWVPGSFHWDETATTLQFAPRGEGFSRSTVYQVALRDTATDLNGQTLAEPLRFTFRASDALEVTQALPLSDTNGVDLQAELTVMFNRPVVPLTALAQQSTLPQPLSIEPPLAGNGEWLNTSIYVFHPQGPLTSNTTYTVTVKNGLTDVTGAALHHDYQWSFTTRPPSLDFLAPGGNEVWPDRAVEIRFSQAMDRASVEAAFVLRSAKGAQVSGTFDWISDTLFFTPTHWLERGISYTLQFDGGARSSDGGHLVEDGPWTFTTLPPLTVVDVDPTDGATRIEPYQTMVIRFSAPISTSTLANNIQVEPRITLTDVYTYYSRFDHYYYFGFSPQPATAYTVTIKHDVADIWGQPLDRDHVIHFTTGNRPPQIALAGVSRLGIYAPVTDTAVYVRYLNISQIKAELYPVTPLELAQLMGRNAWGLWQNQAVPVAGQPLRTWSIPVNKPVNHGGLRRIELNGDGAGPLPTSIYLVRVWAPEEQRNDGWGFTRHLLVVADTNVTLKLAEREGLVWATDLSTSRDLSELPVVMIDETPHAIGTGTTKQQGLATVAWPIVHDTSGTVLAVVGRAGEHFGVAFGGWNSRIDSWMFGLNTSFYGVSNPYRVYLYTEKPLYRPGQPVYFKGILRLDDDAHYTIDPQQPYLDVQVLDAQERQIYNQRLPLTDFGTFSGTFTLDADAGLGRYTIRAHVPITNPAIPLPFEWWYGHEPYTYEGTFQVAEYRRPEFQVAVAPEHSEVQQGELITFTAQANYFFGGPVSDAQVKWSVMSRAYLFDRYHGQGRFVWTDLTTPESPAATASPLASGEGRTNAAGQLQITLPADLANKVQSQIFSLEATVTDVNDQESAARANVIVHQSTYYIGLSSDRSLGFVGRPLTVSVQTVDWQGAASGPHLLELTLVKRQWFNVQEQDRDGRLRWTWSFSDTAVLTTSTTMTAQGRAQSTFVPPEGGQYYVRASSVDPAGRVIRSATWWWVASREYISWRRENTDQVPLIADQTSYLPGETAHLMIQSPYQVGTAPPRALITIERGRILERRVIDLTSNSEVIDIPITPEMAPNVFVSVFLLKNVDATNPVLSFKMGYTSFTVNRQQQELKITLAPNQTAHYRPGDPISYTLHVRDFQDRPVQAEVSLALVDLSVLSLHDPFISSLADYFYNQRGLGVRTGSSLVYVVDYAAFTRLAEEAKGGGGGMIEADIDVRGDFPDTAYWNATVTTDANGEATIATRLPDNLTTWRLLAKAVTKETLVGEGTVDVISTKDLLIRPVTPRFLMEGDQVTLAAVVHNNMPLTLTEVLVSLEASGVQLLDQADHRVMIVPHDKVRVEWPVKALPTDRADLIFTVRSGALSDASKPTAGLPPDQHLPIYRYSTPETMATAGMLTPADEARTEAIALPDTLDTTQGEVTVQIDPSLAAASTTSLKYLTHYPYECTEQTVSRFLPNVLTYRALHELNLTQADLEAQLRDQVSVGLQQLYGYQHADGGWGWWLFDRSNLTVSTYVLFGLVKAQQAGFVVDEHVLSGGLNYLRNNLVPAVRIESTEQADQQAYLLYVLAEARQAPIPLGESIALYDTRRGALSHYGKALLALALQLEQPDEHSRTDVLWSDLMSAALASATGLHWEEAAHAGSAWSTDTRSTALILDALVHLDPTNPQLPNVVRWLMSARRADHWATTQETAWSLIALTDWMKFTGELNPDYMWKVSLDHQLLGGGVADQTTVTQTTMLRQAVSTLIANPSHTLVIERGALAEQRNTGQLYYSTYLRTFMPVTEVKALSRGIFVARQYFLSTDPCFRPRQKEESPISCTPVTSAHIGDVLQVKVSLVVPHDLDFVLLEDPLPAGVEAIDASLKTTTQLEVAPRLQKVTSFLNTYGWGWWWFVHTELHDEKVAMFATHLPAGTYDYTYQVRASLAGTFNVMPSHAEEMYFPEIFGRGDGAVFVITR